MADESVEFLKNMSIGKLKSVDFCIDKSYFDNQKRGRMFIKLNKKHRNLTDNERIEIHIKNGEKLIAQYKIEEAIVEYTEAIKIDQTCVRAYNKRGHAYFSLAKWTKAIMDFAMILSLAPDELPGGNSSEDFERWIKNSVRALKAEKKQTKKKIKTTNSDTCFNFQKLCEEIKND